MYHSAGTLVKYVNPYMTTNYNGLEFGHIITEEPIWHLNGHSGEIIKLIRFTFYFYCILLFLASPNKCVETKVRCCTWNIFIQVYIPRFCYEGYAIQFGWYLN